jgi:WXG100 family type VII secretion target
MSSPIKVTFGEIQGAQGHVTQTAQQMNAQLEDLQRMLAPLVSTWTGEAATDYAAKKKQWDTAAADLNQVLAKIGTALGTANEGYQNVERANASRWS